MAKTKSDYNLIADKFASTRQHNWDDINSLIQIYVKTGDKILDLGCGNGRLISILPENISYNGIDISTELIKKARTRYPHNNFQIGNLLSLPYADQTFDTIIAIASLNHIPSDQLRQQAINEIHRVLKNNGIFITSNWNLDQDKYKKYFNLDPQLDANDAMIPWKDNLGKTIANRYYHLFTLEEIEQLLSRFELQDNLITDRNFITVAKKVD